MSEFYLTDGVAHFCTPSLSLKCSLFVHSRAFVSVSATIRHLVLPLSGQHRRRDAVCYAQGRGPTQIRQGLRGLPQKNWQDARSRVDRHREIGAFQGARPLRSRLVLHPLRGARPSHLHQESDRRRCGDENFRRSQTQRHSSESLLPLGRWRRAQGPPKLGTIEAHREGPARRPQAHQPRSPGSRSHRRPGQGQEQKTTETPGDPRSLRIVSR